jgi:hypothetical protein
MLNEKVLETTSAAAGTAVNGHKSPLIIEAIGLHKIYDTGKVKVHALRGVDLSIRQGEMVSPGWMMLARVRFTLKAAPSATCRIGNGPATGPKRWVLSSNLTTCCLC